MLEIVYYIPHIILPEYIDIDATYYDMKHMLVCKTLS